MKQIRDGVLSATAADGTIRAVAVVSTQTVEDARIRHTTSATATAALGRSLTAAALMGAGLKEGQSVLLRVLGDGPIGAVIAQANAEGHVRGYAVHPHADLPHTQARKLDVGGLVGRNGMLHVTRDLGLRTPYHGCAPLVSGEIAEDLASYFVTSEQVPSVVALGVLVGPDLRVLASGGVCVQALPGARREVIDELDARARRLPPITQMMSAGQSAEEILAVSLGDLSPHLGPLTPLAFHCRCSRERVEGMLSLLGAAELQALLEEEGRAEVTCRFCGDRYVLSETEVRELIARLNAAPPDLRRQADSDERRSKGKPKPSVM